MQKLMITTQEPQNDFSYLRVKFEVHSENLLV